MPYCCEFPLPIVLQNSVGLQTVSLQQNVVAETRVLDTFQEIQAFLFINVYRTRECRHLWCLHHRTFHYPGQIWYNYAKGNIFTIHAIIYSFCATIKKQCGEGNLLRVFLFSCFLSKKLQCLVNRTGSLYSSWAIVWKCFTVFGGTPLNL